MNTPTVVGLDLSLTGTGIAHGDGTTTVAAPKTSGDRRLLTIVDAVADATGDAALVVVEDLPVHARSAGVTGMVHGAVRALLLRRDIPYTVVPPATLKRFATGRGNATKTDMAVAAFKRAALEFGDDNQCDAWWLWAAGLAHLDLLPFALPKAQVDALRVVTWPRPRTVSACCGGTGLADYAAVPCPAPDCPVPPPGAGDLTSP